MIVCRVKTVTETAQSDTGYRVLSETLITASSIGEALDHHAPDPADGAVFIVEIVGHTTVL